MRQVDRSAVVTGASGEIGRAVCARLADGGYGVFATYRSNRASVEELAVRRSRGWVEPIQLELSDLDAVQATARKLAEEHPITVLVHCAGELPRDKWSETTNTTFMRSFAVNCGSAFVLARELAASMIKAGKGSIVNVASIHALVGSQKRAAYSTSKAALVGLTRALAVELAPLIRVNAVVPGVFQTSMNAALLADPHLLSHTRERIPMGRLGTAEECAEAIVFLTGPLSAYVTGTTLVIDGGILSRNALPAGDASAT